MSDTISAKDITLYNLEKKFDLRLSEAEQFFSEWQTDASETTPDEKKFLDMAKAAYMNLIKYSAMPENAVKLTVLSPLLHLVSLLLVVSQIWTYGRITA